MTLNLNDVKTFLLPVMRTAGKMSINFAKAGVSTSEKSSFSDLVTEADKAVEAFVVEAIEAAFPDHGILGEEGVSRRLDSEYLWIIDPIDGTTNFVHGRTPYGVSVALTKNGAGVAGAVYDPTLDELFYGDITNGAELNGERVTIKPVTALNETLISTAMFFEDVRTKDALHHGLISAYKKTRGIRMDGCAAVELCHVALGRINAYIMPMLQPWDYGAGKIFVEAAGGIVTRLDGSEIDQRDRGSIIATHKNVHQELVELFK
jgi:myo-inositol-1(or 4)-monophosphatase